ncbi:transcriptional repressor NrdR [Vallitalea pronyensis]|uniref:Transcriptional repressor NrdR n=1 Tax=Vallitalea pronyensis TaxID=1348613 RepID=A0A8J8MKA2_9FIRM|nr:transcriptional regulator NrdR [Vallitalea pronyensis]QUI23214.1 transcriptional repressor NrdR [Vallitalea pronyensis]
MRCPFCHEDNTKVVDSRPSDENNLIRRRRQCEACGKRFTTYEKIETIPLVVIKKDKTREPYNRNKIMNGVVRSCHKRPVSMKEIEALVDEIENSLYNSLKKEIKSKLIGEKVMEKLKHLDEVAYVRFASIYREFKDINTFMDELKKILKDK